MGQRFHEWSRPIDNAGQSMKGFSLASAGAFVGVIKSSSDFQYAMTRVKAISQATGNDFDMLKGRAKELGATTQFSATEAANAMEFLAMAGFKPKEIYEALPAVLNGASAANMDLARTADVVSNIMTGYGLKAAEATRATDLLTKASQLGNVNVEMLGESFKYGTSFARLAGLSVEEAAAAYTLLGSAGLQGSMGGTALGASLRSMLKPSKFAKQTMDQVGLSFLDASGKMKPLPQIIDEVGAAGLTAEQFMRIFGTEGARAMTALSEQGSGALKDLTKELESSAGTTDRFAAEIGTTAKAGMQGFTSAVEGLAIAIGESGLLEAFTKVTNKVTEWVRALTNAPGPVHSTIGILLVLGAVVSPLLLVFSRLGKVVIALAKPWKELGSGVSRIGTAMVGASRGVSLFVAGFRNLGTATSGLSAMALLGGKLKNFFQILKAGASAATVAGPVLRGVALGIRAISLAIMANPIVAAIAAVIAVLVLLYVKCEWFRDAVNAVWEAIKTAAVAVWDWIAANVIPAAKAVWDGIVAAFEWGVDLAISVYESIRDSVMAVWDWISANVLPVVKAIWDGIVAAFQFGVDLVTVIIAVVKGVVLAVWDAIAAIVVPLVQGLWSVITTAFEAGKAAVSAVMTVLQTVISAAWDAIKAVWDFVVTWLWPPLQAAFEAVRAGVSAAMNAVSSVISAIWSGIKAAWQAAVNYLGPPVSAAFNAVRSVVQTVMNAVSSVISSVWGAIKSAWNAAVNALKPPITSAFNAIKSVVTTVMNAIRSAVDAAWNLIKSAFNTAVSIVKGAINGFVSAVQTGARSPEKLTQAVRDMTGKVIGWFRELPGRITGALGNMGRLLYDKGKQVVQGLINGIKSMASAVGGAVKNVASKLNPANWFSLSVPEFGGAGPEAPQVSFSTLAGGMEAFAAPVAAPFAAPMAADPVTDALRAVQGKVGSAFSDFEPDGVYKSLASFSLDRQESNSALAGDRATPSITVNARTEADPYEIGREVAWTLRTMGR
ncbi:phage tail tape measure protein [Streptomyces sp. NPDC090442]|uniref:phage tail tape measure protein n=1 Tax=Streptomyces sp. NPDC090442 TaxID=3365962 RepID=UPI0038283E89